jgi:hypothetical protein
MIHGLGDLTVKSMTDQQTVYQCIFDCLLCAELLPLWREVMEKYHEQML